MMLKITATDSLMMTANNFRPRDLENAAGSLPVQNKLLLKPTLALMMPFTHEATRTIAIDTEFGPYATRMETQTVARTLGIPITPFHDQLNWTRRRVAQQLGIHGRPPRVISYLTLFYFPLGRSESGGPIWIAGHNLKDLTIIGPGVVRAQFQTPAGASFTVTLSSQTLPDARRLSLLQQFAAEVTRAMQPVLRAHYGLVYFGAEFDLKLLDNFAHLARRGDPVATGESKNLWRAQAEVLWRLLDDLLEEEGTFHDLAQLRAEFLERVRHYQ